MPSLSVRSPSNHFFQKQRMKRGYVRTLTYCKVCRSEWTPRHFRWIMKEFDNLNPKRSRGTHQRMNDAQYHYLLRYFFHSSGEHKNLCRKHLIEFASISKGKVGDLISMAQHPIDWEKPWLDFPPNRPNFPPHNILPQEIDRLLLDFLEEGSAPLSNEQGYALDASFRSKREVYRVFKEKKLASTGLSISRRSFLCHWNRLRPDVVLHTHQSCACSTCTAFHSSEEKFKSNRNAPVLFLPFTRFNISLFLDFSQCSAPAPRAYTESASRTQLLCHTQR